jgi:hypothetical protein
MSSFAARFPLAVCLLGVVLGLAGCSSSRTTTSPTPAEEAPPSTPAPTLSAPSGIQLASLDIRQRAALVSWTGVANATSYVVEVSTASGQSNFAVITTGNSNTVLQLTDLPAGGYVYARVRAQGNNLTSPPSSELRFYLQDYKYLLEALAVQTGPYYPTPAPFDGVRGWPAGTTVRIRLSNTVTAEQRRGLETVAAQLAVSGAPYRATIEVMDNNQPTFRRNEIQVVTLANACGTGMGCTVYADTSLRQGQAQVFGSVVLYLGTAGERGDAADIAAHEMGHALFGLWHVHYQNVAEAPQYPSHFGTLEFPFMTMYASAEPVFRSPNDRLSDLELHVVQDLFRSGVTAGARRADLQARGLIY